MDINTMTYCCGKISPIYWRWYAKREPIFTDSDSSRAGVFRINGSKIYVTVYRCCSGKNNSLCGRGTGEQGNCAEA
jgi:hypothetical protein